MEPGHGPEEGPGGPPGPAGPEGPPGPGQDPGCASFNQDSTSLAVGAPSGYRLYSLTSVDALDCIYHSDSRDVLLVERLFGSSLVVLVNGSAPHTINIYHFKKNTQICSYSYPRPVLRVRLNRQRLVVCLEDSVYIHNIKDLKLLQTLEEVPVNGLCALSSCASFLAFPHSTSCGDLRLHDAMALTQVSVIPAHSSPLAALCFNASASRLASASQKGTVIRVFSVPDGQRLYEFRRGVKRCVNISCLSFSSDGHFLCCSSNTETVHIFRMDQPLENSEAEDGGSWGSYVGRIFSAASSLLPAPVSDMMSQDRAFATAQLPQAGARTICTLTLIQKLPRLLVVTDGKLLVYSLDLTDGGRCSLCHSHQLFPEEDQTEEVPGSSLPGASCPSYAATAALPPAPGLATATLTGYSEDAGCREGAVIPEHELAAAPVRLDDENEFPPISCRDESERLQGSFTFDQSDSFCKL